MTVLSSEKLFEVIRSPLISEKATFISQFNYYVFKVSPSSNKLQIKEAIEKVFNVKVKSVNTLVQKGKKKKFRNKIGVRADIKKAFVKLESGNSIDTTVEIK